MLKPINCVYGSFGLFFEPAYLDMKPAGNGPKHVHGNPGVEVDAEGNACFRFFAPQAEKVEVAGLGGGFSNEKVPMVKGEDGVWSVTIPKMKPGFHYHQYFVNDICVTNPQAPYAYGCHQTINFLEVPDPEDTTYLCKDVPHGGIHMELIASTKTGMMRNCWVYTPPGYFTETVKHYPVLYLHHGGGENETGWLWQGKINYIADNLISEGLCREMIIVMPCLYDMNYDEEEEFLPGDYDYFLTHDLMPFVDSRYRTIQDSDHRAICGLSMGSYHSAQVSCNHPGMFGYTGMLSGSFNQRWYCWCDCRDIIANNQVFKEKTRLFFMAVGSSEARIYDWVQENVDYLKVNGVANDYFECPGFHEWTVWRKSVRYFMTKLF